MISIVGEVMLSLLQAALEFMFDPRRPGRGEEFSTWWAALPWWSKIWAMVTWIVFAFALIVTVWLVIMILWWIAGRIFG